ncbi:hypothetical protein Bpfe_030508, partial [Biomphalaria pfeifferi]
TFYITSSIDSKAFSNLHILAPSSLQTTNGERDYKKKKKGVASSVVCCLLQVLTRLTELIPFGSLAWQVGKSRQKEQVFSLAESEK